MSKYTVVIEYPIEIADASGIDTETLHVEAVDHHAAMDGARELAQAAMSQNEDVGPDLVTEHSPFFVNAVFAEWLDNLAADRPLDMPMCPHCHTRHDVPTSDNVSFCP